MKKLYLAGLVMGAATMFAVAANAGTTPNSGIVGSRHDMNANGGTYADDNQNLARVCIYCHTPHFAKKPNASLTYSPLWNRDNPTLTYVMYDNGDNPQEYGDHDNSASTPDVLVNHNSYAAENGDVIFDAITGLPTSVENQPAGVSLMCLSCHDGSIAINAYGTSPSSSTNAGTADKEMDPTTKYYIGGGADPDDGIGDLSNHHPIGFNYNEAAARDDEINDSSSPLGLYTIADLLSSGGNMECNTCHDVHNTKNEGEKFVWMDNTGSAFCIACHDK